MDTIIGFIAAFLTTSAFLPQALHIIRTQQTAGISLAMYCVFAAGVFLWLVFGVMIGSSPIIAANAVTLSLSLIIIALKLKYERLRRERGPA